MAAGDTRELIERAVRRFQEEVPALERLKLVATLELRGRGDTQIYRVEVPGPTVTKVVPTDAKVTLSVPRVFFNELAKDGQVADWREAIDHGHLKVSGPEPILKLIANVVERHEERDRLSRTQRR